MELTAIESHAIATQGLEILPYLAKSATGQVDPGRYEDEPDHWVIRLEGRLAKVDLGHLAISSALRALAWGSWTDRDGSLVLNPYHHLAEDASANVRAWVTDLLDLDPPACAAAVLYAVYGPAAGAQMYAETMYLLSQVTAGETRPRIVPRQPEAPDPAHSSRGTR